MKIAPLPANSTTRRNSSIVFYISAFAGLFLLYWFMAGSAVFRNDELQHLHTSLSAAEGKLPYRDYFDNHVPAFQFLSAIEIHALSIRPSPDFPVKMRRLALPWLAAQLLLLVLISRAVIYKETEQYLSTALLAGALLPFMAAQARPEPLWCVLFFFSLYLFSSGLPTVKRFILLGLVNGLNACVSLKTLAFPVLPELLSLPLMIGLYQKELTVVSVAGFLGGLLFFPGLLILYFSRSAALPEFLKFAVLYSIQGASHAGHTGLTAAGMIFASGLSFFAAKHLRNPAYRRRAAFFAPVLFSSAVLALYPVREAQTLFPFRILAYLLLSAAAVLGIRRALPGAAARRFALICLVSGVVCVRLAAENAFSDNNASYSKALGVMLKLQPGPGGTVMDAKGESLFWRRPFFYALETFAVQGIRAGTISDSIPQDCAREATPVVFLKYADRFTAPDIRFFTENYLPVCGAPQVHAAGKELSKETFETLLPLKYRILCAAGPANGIIDGKKYGGGAIDLSPGPHSFKAASSCGRPLLIWDGAVESGELPCGYAGDK